MSALPQSDPRDRALATLGAMTATVAHEMRNLLGGIELYASLLAEQCSAESELAPLTGRLLDGVKRLHAVSSNLLSVSRRRERTVERLPIDLFHLVQEVVNGAALSVPGTGIRVVLRSNAAKVPVLGDAEQLRQALLNLVLNAVQAMPQGGVLTVGTRLLGNVVEVSVRDTGVGMDSATLRRAFEPFFSTRAHGTGLGLAVVREVADAHGARLRVTSKPGRGTAFRLTVPLAPADGGAE